MIEHQLQYGSGDETRGKATLNIDNMQDATLDGEWETERLLGDIIMCEIIDEPENGEVQRGGIWVSLNATRKIWRLATVLMVGPAVRDIKVGDTVRYPNDKGIPMVSSKTKKKLIYLNEERVFDIVKKV